MFKRLICCFAVCLLCLLLPLSGCDRGGDVIHPSQIPSDTISPSQSPSLDLDPYLDYPNILPVMIMVEDTIYQQGCGVLDPSIRIDDSQILGRISEVIGNERPSHNGEANFLYVGTRYARCPLEEYSDCIVVFYAQQWHIFHPVDS
ncbi:MAG: hypothetical protein HDT33_01780 [Clostridiales bacterium]|nr:hypothetical protein [Clostridiales bacterium]